MNTSAFTSVFYQSELFPKQNKKHRSKNNSVVLFLNDLIGSDLQIWHQQHEVLNFLTSHLL